jgi:DNA-directed RNA polymerase specialized sigma24 family protein
VVPEDRDDVERSKSLPRLKAEEAWALCVRRHRRLILLAVRMGLAEQAEDLVHDAFVQAMEVPALYQTGFDALLDTIMWRHCFATRRRQAVEDRVQRDARLRPGVQHDHADEVVDRVHAAWLVSRCGSLARSTVEVLDLAGHGLGHRDIAARTGTDPAAVRDLLRSSRAKARRAIERVDRSLTCAEASR